MDREIQQAYDRIAEEYLETRTSSQERVGWQNRHIERPIILGLVPQELIGKKILDLGCGPGIHAKEYSDRGGQVFGIDLSHKMIQLAKEKCPEGNFITGTLSALPFADKTVNIVTASFVFDHVADLESTLEEVRRVLIPGGLLFYSAPHPLTYMFRDSPKEGCIPSHSYFNKDEIRYHSISTQAEIPGYPRTMQDHMDAIIQHFSLEKYFENEPEKSWKELPFIKELEMKIPSICFFKCKKK